MRLRRRALFSMGLNLALKAASPETAQSIYLLGGRSDHIWQGILPDRSPREVTPRRPTWRSRRTVRGRRAAGAGRLPLTVSCSRPAPAAALRPRVISKTLAPFSRRTFTAAGPAFALMFVLLQLIRLRNFAPRGRIAETGKDLRSAVGSSDFTGYAQEVRCRFRRALTARSRRPKAVRPLFKSRAAVRLALR